MLHKSMEKSLLKRFPEAVALIVSKSKSGDLNVCPVGYFALASYDPKVWAVSIYRGHSTNKFIKETKEFVLCLPSLEQTDDLMIAGSVRFDKNKMRKLHLEFIKVKESQIPIIKGSIACFICSVVRTVGVGDHTTFFGKIVKSYSSNISWKQKVYNWDDKRLGNLGFGKDFKIMNFSPEGAVKGK